MSWLSECKMSQGPYSYLPFSQVTGDMAGYQRRMLAGILAEVKMPAPQFDLHGRKEWSH